MSTPSVILTHMQSKRALGLLAVLAIASSSFAQNPVKIQTPWGEGGIVDFWTSIGSFKIVSPGEKKCYGSLDMTFNGTVLVVGLEGTLTTGGSVRKEYENKKWERQAYFGTGKISIKGRWTSIQFFGKNMRSHWEGLGICRLYGEFDKNLETGYFQIKGDQKLPWMQGGNMFVLPRPVETIAKPRVRKEG